MSKIKNTFLITAIIVLVILSLSGMTAAMVAKCSDGVDNDDDGKTDYSDDCGCVSLDDNDESNCVGDTNCNCSPSPEPILAITAVMALAPAAAYGLARRRRTKEKK